MIRHDGKVIKPVTHLPIFLAARINEANGEEKLGQILILGLFGAFKTQCFIGHASVNAVSYFIYPIVSIVKSQARAD